MIRFEQLMFSFKKNVIFLILTEPPHRVNEVICKLFLLTKAHKL